MEILGIIQFDQCAINISLINLCNQESYICQEMYRHYHGWCEETHEAVENPWRNPYQFAIYIPHPDQKYEDMTLAEALTKGYNIDVQPIKSLDAVPYQIPPGGHFVIILRQIGVDASFTILATGIFVRPLGVLSLDVVTDAEKGTYQPLIVQHPIIRDYPHDWQEKLRQFLKREIRSEELPGMVRYVDQAYNQDYRPPSWHEVYLATRGFAGF